jgi:hypothetical protein
MQYGTTIAMPADELELSAERRPKDDWYDPDSVEFVGSVDETSDVLPALVVGTKRLDLSWPLHDEN